MTTPSVCVSEHLVVGADGKLRLAPWSVPRLVADEIAHSGADTTKLLETSTLPGRLLIDKPGVMWTNLTPVDHMVRIMVTRRWKRWITSNPNAVQFRDRWSTAITPKGSADVLPAEPVVSGIFNSQCGSAGDLGSNTVAEPVPGKFWAWWGTNTSEEWIGPVAPEETLRVHYRSYVWTPPPFSDNANKNAPAHEAEAGYARIQLMAFPQQGKVVTG
ncbi:hypothetical protein FDI63_gp032 [Mycobacterium phage ChrisnMich]|uniref:DUF7172 domain-containing protein n=2 Tax=Coopervirus TaxID=1982898 RepID=G1BL89_9CAUD|nr:hypothetical protein CH22_gp33 [Mycobacterium phage JAMaL]YP_009614355.1 hypothetical protein FDI63_gp032 [Mycobacterium phage ChrisnMich]AEJ94641.1 hypothetical protein CHRISNMICH_32 [Mycobacterium phage ChrisnMich]AHB79353.1 hypothetical protein JAMAL_33 [Mycobacterium phage JAMaL]